MTLRLALARPALLAPLASARPLLAFDLDGVLAPIVARPEDVEFRPRTRALLMRLASQATCAVISGRSLASLGQIARGIPFKELVGNHGAEWRGHPLGGEEAIIERARGWLFALAPVVAGLAGVEIEDKGLSLSLHYRRAREPERAKRILRIACRSLSGARIIPGKQLVNVVSDLVPNKGQALLALCRKRRATAALFVGDDRTDEDAFAVRIQWPTLLTICIGRPRPSQALYRLPSQRDIDPLLETLVGLTARAGPRSARRQSKGGPISGSRALP